MNCETIDQAVIDNIATPSRVMAPMQWYGGKGNLAKKIVPLLPDGRVYVEPFMGAASVFWHLKPPRQVEVLNDLDGEVVNLFRVLQDADLFKQFAHRITWTLYSFEEFKRALDCESTDPLDRAWAFFVRQNQGFGGKAETEGDWGRAFVKDRGMAHTANKWRGRVKLLRAWHDRLSRVQLDNRDAIDVVTYWDSADTVFYLDPPYVGDTRKDTDVYAHECDDNFHARLVGSLLAIQGQAVLSGYDHKIYLPLEGAGWERHEFQTACHAAGRGRGSKLRGKGAATEHVARIEVLWIKRHEQEEGLLF